MAIYLVAGPFKDRAEAERTAAYLGDKNHSVYGVHLKDKDGYVSEECDYFVERDDAIVPERLFGYDAQELLAKQYRRG